MRPTQASQKLDWVAGKKSKNTNIKSVTYLIYVVVPMQAPNMDMLHKNMRIKTERFNKLPYKYTPQFVANCGSSY